MNRSGANPTITEHNTGQPRKSRVCRCCVPDIYVKEPNVGQYGRTSAIFFEPFPSVSPDTTVRQGFPPQRKWTCGHGNIDTFGLAGDFIVLALLPGKRPFKYDGTHFMQENKGLVQPGAFVTS